MTLALRHLLVAVDGSTGSPHALARAQQLADACGARLTPLTVRDGPVPEAIAQRAHALDADLIVLGSGSSAPLQRFVRGGTADRLLHDTRRPLLVVRNPVDGSYRKPLVAVDFSPWTLRTLELAAAVAPRVPLTLLHAYQIPFEEKLRFAGVDEATVGHYRDGARREAAHHLHGLAASQGLQAADWTPCLVEGDAAPAIVAQAQAAGCDLVVVGKHGRGAVEELLLGSVTKYIVEESRVDVLVSSRRQP